nr:hypothetical protein GCM10020092_035900 [Actinoplanes digitatis]
MPRGAERVQVDGGERRPLVRLLELVLGHLGLLRVAERAGVHERRVRDVAAVLQDPLVVGVPQELAGDRAEPAAVLDEIVELGPDRDRRPLLLGQVTQVDPDEPVPLLRRVRVDAGLARHGPVGLRRDLHALAVRLVLPAVVRADDAVVLEPAAGERRAPVHAQVGQRDDLPRRRAVDGEVLAEHGDPG